ncbi:MAG: S8 family serine peptidase [Ruminococcus sp.]|nr:S8 family serine peptidase [Ruminococcus sp.]
MKKRKSEILLRTVSAAVSVAVSVMLLGSCGSKSKPGNSSDASGSVSDVRNNTYDENNVGEIYCSPVDPEHIAGEENGIMYADNELLVVASFGTPKSRIEALAAKYNAEITGYIEQTGDYQWRLSQSISEDELIRLAENVQSNKEITSCSLNRIFELSDSSVDYDISCGNEWSSEGVDNYETLTEYIDKTWHLHITNTFFAWEYMEGIKADIEPVRVGVIDSYFLEGNDDLTFAQLFYNGEFNDVKKEDIEKHIENSGGSLDHGIHVAGIMAANGANDEGICGVYPYSTDKNKNSLLYGVSRIGYETKVENVSFWKSSMFYKVSLAELILRNVKVINISQGFNRLGTFYDDKSVLSSIEDEGCLLGDYLNRLLDMGYDFVIVNGAGNDSDDIVTTVDMDSLDKDKKTVDYSPDGQKVIVEQRNNGYYYEKNNVDYKVVKANDIKTFCANNDYPGYLGHLDATYNAIMCAVPNNDTYREVYNRIIVVGSVDKDMSISDFSNSGPRVDIYAPGGEFIYSTVPNGYDYKSGTSMAAPMVAGAAADVWSVDPSLKGDKVKEIICNNPLKGSEKTYSILDVYSSVAAAYEARGKGEAPEVAVPEKGALLGWVYTDSTKTAAEGAVVRAYKDGERIAETTTDEFGHYELFLDSGEYTVSAELNGETTPPITETIYEGQVIYAQLLTFGKAADPDSPAPGSADPAKVKESYDEILERYSVGLQTGWSDYNEGDRTNYLERFGDEPEKVGYMLKDLNGDGIDELIIGLIYENNRWDFEHNRIIELFSYKNGGAELILSSWRDRSEFFLVNDNKLLHHQSGTGASNSYSLLEFSPYMFDVSADTTYVFIGSGECKYHEAGGESVSITFDEYDAYKAEWSQYADFTLTPIINAVDKKPEPDPDPEPEPPAPIYPADSVEFEGHHYKVFSGSEGFDVYQSENACEEMGGHLVSINSSAEQDLVTSLLGDKDNYWIGLERSGSGWRWMDGSSFSFTNWDYWVDAKGKKYPQPDNMGGSENNCRIAGRSVTYDDWYMNKGGWIDTNGDGKGEDLSTFGYICEWDS